MAVADPPGLEFLEEFKADAKHTILVLNMAEERAAVKYKVNIAMLWPREVLDRIIAEESRQLEPLLGRPVKSWRKLVGSIGWSWLLERAEGLIEEVKPWIGPNEAEDAEREGLVRGMLGELALFVHFAEARRGMDDRKWRKERIKRLTRAVEALSGGRIRGEYAERLARLIISYAEGHKKYKEVISIDWLES